MRVVERGPQRTLCISSEQMRARRVIVIQITIAVVSFVVVVVIVVIFHNPDVELPERFHRLGRRQPTPLLQTRAVQPRGGPGAGAGAPGGGLVWVEPGGGDALGAGAGRPDWGGGDCAADPEEEGAGALRGAGAGGKGDPAGREEGEAKGGPGRERRRTVEPIWVRKPWEYSINQRDKNTRVSLDYIHKFCF